MLKAQTINDVIEKCARPLDFSACVKACRGVDPFVTEDLPYDLIPSRLLVKKYLAGKMTEEMDVEGQAGELKHSLLDLHAKRMSRFVPAAASRE